MLPPSAWRKVTSVEYCPAHLVDAPLEKLLHASLSSRPRMSVEQTMASCRCLADNGGTPCRITFDLSILSAALAFATHLLVCSAKLNRRESSQIPSHLMASVEENYVRANLDPGPGTPHPVPPVP